MAELTIQLDACRVDLAAAEVDRGGERVGLTPNELALLRYLVAHEGEAIGKDQLHVEVFGYAPGVVSRAADYAVHRLRRKLERDPSDPTHLLTVPGVGFRLVLSTSDVAPPTPEPSDASHNLPAEVTSFRGRQAELQALTELLDTARLVTLVGPGGVGKTRLARRVGIAWHAQHHRSVRLCLLADARDADEIRSTVAAVIGVSGPAERLPAVLASAGPVLLILDDLERVVGDAAAVIGEWLQVAPDLRVLATSRERLRASGEHVVELGALDDDDALALFADRARMARPTWSADDDDVLALVRRLDGLPLAVELTAARSTVMSPRQMLERLASDRSALDETLSWSWELLDSDERSALCQLTAFRGPFDLDDAEAVVALDGGSVVDVVQALRDKSMLAEAPAADAVRLVLLQTVRDFVEARASGELSGAWARHRRWVVHRTWDAALRGRLGDSTTETVLAASHADRVAAVERPSEELEGLARALIVAAPTWSRSRAPQRWLEHVQQVAAGELSDDLRRQLWLAQGVFCKGATGLEDPARAGAEGVLALADEAPADRAHAWLLLGSLHRRQHHFDESEADLDRAAEALGRVEPGPLHVSLEVHRGVLDIQRQRTAEARAHLLRALELCSEHGAHWFEPLICVNLAVLLSWEGREREQISMARRALLRAREHGQRPNEQRALLMLAVAESETGALDAAARHCADLLAACEADHSYDIACDGLVVLAGVELARGHLEEVEGVVRRARRLASHARAPWHVAWIDWWEALAGWARWGSLDEARHLLERALERARGHLPVGEVQIEARLLAVRAHLEPEAADELRAALAHLERRAQELHRDDIARTIAVDALHVDLALGDLAPARAQLQTPSALDPAVHGLGMVVSRLLLASALAAHDHGDRNSSVFGA